MRRTLIMTLAVTFGLGAASAFAQDGDLSGVTMRVLDDVSDVDAVILELDANRSEGEDASERGGAGSDDASSAEREAATPTTPDRFAEPRKELHDPDDDERSEGKLEDNDVEQPAPTP
jgi:hypothetical protein